MKNSKWLDIRYALIKAFMVDADPNILDISHTMDENEITIQVVMIENTKLSEYFKNNISSILPEYKININEIYISKEKFNENKGEWIPINYPHLKYLLFSKAEVL